VKQLGVGRFRVFRSIRHSSACLLLTLIVVSALSVFGLTHAEKVLAATHSPLAVTKEQVFLLPTKSNDLQVLLQPTVQNQASVPEDFHVQLPKGASQATVQGVPANQVQQIGQELVVHAGAKPGNSTETISYTLPFANQTSIGLTLHTDYPVYVMSIYVPIGNVALSAPGLMPVSQTTSIAGMDFRVFSHGEMAANTDWTASLSMLPAVTNNQAVQGLPIIGMSSQSSSTTWEAISNLLMAAVILMIALIGIKSTVGKGIGRQQLTASESLMNSWEETERSYQQGQLDEADYQKRTLVLKRRLAELRQAELGKR
jgi:hypothetical protein